RGNSPTKMRTGKGNQEEDDYGEEDFVSKREGPSSNNSNSTAAASRGNFSDPIFLFGMNLIFFEFCEADAKENDKASAIRSKHSVTEQRRRSKINERFVDFQLFKKVSSF